MRPLWVVEEEIIEAPCVHGFSWPCTHAIWEPTSEVDYSWAAADRKLQGLREEFPESRYRLSKYVRAAE